MTFWAAIRIRCPYCRTTYGEGVVHEPNYTATWCFVWAQPFGTRAIVGILPAYQEPPWNS